MKFAGQIWSFEISYITLGGKIGNMSERKLKTFYPEKMDSPNQRLSRHKALAEAISRQTMVLVSADCKSNNRKFKDFFERSREQHDVLKKLHNISLISRASSSLCSHFFAGDTTKHGEFQTLQAI